MFGIVSCPDVYITHLLNFNTHRFLLTSFQMFHLYGQHTNTTTTTNNINNNDNVEFRILLNIQSR